MESDQSSPENLVQVTAAEQGASHGRSYDCTFCKRGFSNAQALGGHMNMHRRQKAKLKPFSSEYEATSDIPRVIPSDRPIPENPSWPLGANSSDGRRTIKWPWISSQHGFANTRDETDAGDGYKLPLFVETPSDKDQTPGSQHQEKTEEGLASTSADESGSQIDLVLRLGPGPPEPSTEPGTKKFF